MTAVLGPHVALNHTSAGGSEGASMASKLFLSAVSIHVTFEVVVGVGSIGTVGAGVWLLTRMCVHVSLKVSDKMGGVGAVGTLVHLPVALILAQSSSSPAALHYLLGMLGLLIG